MKASELIKRLQDLAAEHGDLDVGGLDEEMSYYGPINSIELEEASPDPDWRQAHESLGARWIGMQFKTYFF